MSEQTRYTIIGNSAAGIGAVEAIRERDPRGRITVLSKEPYHAYSRPLISYWLGGKVDDDAMPYRDEDFYERHDVEPKLGVRAVGLDSERRVVKTEDGEEVPYDRLLVATGGAPMVPPQMEGAEAEGVFTFTTWNEARAIREYCESHGVSRAVVVGAGLIGLKSTEALVQMGLDVSVVELADRVLGATFDRTASDMAEAAMERAGVNVRCEDTISRIRREAGHVSGVTLRSGDELDADLVMMAIGVRPNVQPVAGSPVEVDRGILVDEHMETSVGEIYAAGDVAQAPELLSEGLQTLAILPDAYRQGAVAGANMAGETEKYAGGLPMNSVDVFGLPTISVGETDPDDEDAEILIDRDEAERIYKKLVLRRGVLVGAIFIGDIERAGIYTGLIRRKVDVSDYREVLLSEEFGLLSLPADYRKHVVSGMGMEV